MDTLPDHTEARAATGASLTCSTLPGLIDSYLRVHIRYFSLVPELERRTIDSYLRRVDPSRSVLLESQVESINDYFDMPAKMRDKPEVAEAMQGYMDLVNGGRREIYKIEHSA